MHDRRCKMVLLGRRAQRVISQINAAAEKLRHELLEDIRDTTSNLRARAHADLRKSRREVRMARASARRFRSTVRQMNIVQEEEASQGPRKLKAQSQRNIMITLPSARPDPRRSESALRIRSSQWAYLLFSCLRFCCAPFSAVRHVEAAQPRRPRPVTVAKVVTKDVPLYLDEIGTCAAYETVLVQAQVSGVIITRNFQDGSDVKKGDLLFTIDPRPFQAALDQAKAQAELDQVTLKRQEDLRAEKGHIAAGLRHGRGERAEVSGRDRGCPGEPRLVLHKIADQRTSRSAQC